MIAGILKFLSNLFNLGLEQPSPSDIIRDLADLLYTPGNFYLDSQGNRRLEKECLFIPFTDDPKTWPCTIPNTNSMDPVFDAGHENLYICGIDEANQRIMVDWMAEQYEKDPKTAANIIVYKTPNIYAVHRLKAITKDSQGRRWYFQGDNSPFGTQDLGFARDFEIQWLSILTAY